MYPVRSGVWGWEVKGGQSHISHEGEVWCSSRGSVGQVRGVEGSSIG